MRTIKLSIMKWSTYKQYTRNRILKLKNSLRELQKDFEKIKDRESKDTEIKIRKEVEELFLRPVKVSIYDLD